jgi:hypothetical protein
MPAQSLPWAPAVALPLIVRKFTRRAKNCLLTARIAAFRCQEPLAGLSLLEGSSTREGAPNAHRDQKVCTTGAMFYFCSKSFRRELMRGGGWAGSVSARRAASRQRSQKANQNDRADTQGRQGPQVGDDSGVRSGASYICGCSVSLGQGEVKRQSANRPHRSRLTQGIVVLPATRLSRRLEPLR